MKAWNNLLLELEKRFGANTIRQWLYPLKIIKFDACNLYLEAENFFQAQWFEEHIRPIIKNNFYNENYRPIKVHLMIANIAKNEKIKEEKNRLTIQSDSIDTYSTFPFYIVTEKNLSTVQILKESISGINSFNPIYIYGPKNSGKTHLLQASAHKLKEMKKNVLFISASTFTSHVIEAIRTAQMQTFRQAYRNLDALIIDDIHLLAKKFATQEEFFHTFNSLHMSGRTIIVSSNQAQNSLIAIEKRLISRFEWGISLAIDKLLDLKLVLQNQLTLLKMSLSKEIEKYLLDTFKNIFSLKKAIKTLAFNESTAFSDLDKVKSYLTHLVKEENEIKITPERIITAVSSFYGITSTDILGKSQTKECTFPRQFCMYLCREILKMPYMRIGSFFKRDHSTVMTSVNSIKNLVTSQNKDACVALAEISRNLDSV